MRSGAHAGGGDAAQRKRVAAAGRPIASAPMAAPAWPISTMKLRST